MGNLEVLFPFWGNNSRKGFILKHENIDHKWTEFKPPGET